METAKYPSIKKCYWQDVRQAVAVFDPKLVGIIDELSPGKEFFLWKVNYPFGSHIVKDGRLRVPNKANELVNLDDPSLPKELPASLAYSCEMMPIGMVLKNSIEAYCAFNEHIIPWFVRFPGRIFGLWETIYPRERVLLGGTPTNITAGARSIIFLPKMGRVDGYKRLKKMFGIKAPVPESLSDQFFVFKALARSPNFSQDWRTELIFFSIPWYEKLADPSWMKLAHYFLSVAWRDSSVTRGRDVFDLTFSIILDKQSLKPNPYLSDTVKHLYAIAQNIYPAFTVATDDIAAPISEFQKIFKEIYKLNVAPTILHLNYLNKDPMKPSYYSLEAPTIWSFSPRSRRELNKLNNLREIRQIQQMTTEYFLENDLGISHTNLYQTFRRTTYDYYSLDHDVSEEILPSKELIQYDAELIQQNKEVGHPVCISSPFLRGCVRIGTKG